MANNNFKHVSHIKSKVTKTVETGEFYGLTPTQNNSDNTGSSPVKLNIAKRPTADQIIDGEIAVNYLKGHETLTIKNTENEIVGFVNENELYETQEIITNGLIKLKAESSADLKNIENKVTNVEGQLTEFDEGIDDLELVVSSSLNDLNTRINELNGVMASIKALSNVFVKGHEYVDLGLPSGTLWATMNVGANSETDYGLHFAWGETDGYTASQVGTDKQFNWNDYVLNPTHDGSTFTKYKGDDFNELELVDDAARANWGGQWHMPTKEQCQELFNTANCTNQWTTVNGVNGCLFTSVSNRNTLFIPAAGVCNNGSVTNVGDLVRVWTSSLYSDYVSGAWNFNFNSGGGGVSSDVRYDGCSVRAVIG